MQGPSEICEGSAARGGVLPERLVRRRGLGSALRRDRRSEKAYHRRNTGSRRVGVVEGFRPGSLAIPIERSLQNILSEHLGLSQPGPKVGGDRLHFLIVDVSGSMLGKVFPAKALTP